MEGGDVTEADLGRALNALAIPQVVGIGLPDEDNEIDGELLLHVKSVARLVQRAVPGIQIPYPSLVFFPLSESTRIARPAEGDLLNSLTVVVPEDLADPASTNFLVTPDDELFASHVSHATACLAGIWGGTGGQPLEESAHAGEPVARLARCHTRMIEAGYVTDHLATHAFTVGGDGWPNPDPAQYERAKLAETVIAEAARSFVDAHRSVLKRTALPTPDVEPPLTLWAAIKRVVSYIVDRLIFWPIAMVADSIAWFWDTKLAPFVERLAPGSGVRLVRFGREETRNEPLPPRRPEIEDGPVGPAWRDLSSMTVGLVDGGDLPGWLEGLPLRSGSRRLIAESPSNLAPDPDEPSPFGSGLQSSHLFDPKSVDEVVSAELQRAVPVASSLVQQLREAVAKALPASMETPPTTADPTPAETDEGEMPVTPPSSATVSAEAPAEDPVATRIRGLATALLALSEQIRVVLAWQERIASTLLYRIAQELLAELEAVELEATPPSDEELQEAERLEEEAKKVKPRRWRRFVAYSAGLGVVGAWGGLGPGLPSLARPLVVGGALLAWWILTLRSWWRRHVAHSPERRRAQAFREGLVRRESGASWRRDDLVRLERRYEEFLEWGDVLSRFLHRPWVPRPVEYESDRTDYSDAKLPQAARVAYASLGESDVAQLAAMGRASVFRRGWLGLQFDDWLSRATAEWQKRMPSPGVLSGEAPSAFADTSRDADSIRRFVVDLARQGGLRRIDESPLVRGFLDSIGGYELVKTVPAVVDAANLNELPLAPLPDWFEAPTGLVELSDRVRPTVVGVSITTPDGVGWGSGVIVSPDGVAATNRHVVEGATSIEVVLGDGQRMPASVDVVSDYGDLALIRFHPSGPLRAAPPAGRPQLGQGTPVFTLGYPFFFTDTGEPALSWGIVAARRRKLDAGSGMFPGNYVQLNYPAGGGASGSPVFNLAGELIAIHVGGSVDATDQPRGRYISFAVPVDDLLPLLGAVEPDELARVALTENGDQADRLPVEQYLAPLALTPTPCLFGPYGELTAAARAAAGGLLKPAGLVRLSEGAEAEELRVSDFFAPLRIGEPTRAALIRIDWSKAFPLNSREPGETLPWFATCPGDDSQPPTTIQGPTESGLGSL